MPSTTATSSTDPREWRPLLPTLHGIVKFDFDPPKNLDPVASNFLQSVAAGDAVHLIEESDHWFRVYVFPAVGTIGNVKDACIIPKSVVQVLSHEQESNVLKDINLATRHKPHPTLSGTTSRASQRFPILDIATAALRDWSLHLDRLIGIRNYEMHASLEVFFRQVDHHCQILLSENLSQAEVLVCSDRLHEKVMAGNRLLGVALDETALDSKIGSWISRRATTLAPNLQIDSHTNTLDTAKQNYRHFFFSYKGFVTGSPELIDTLYISFQIINKNLEEVVSESFLVGSGLRQASETVFTFLKVPGQGHLSNLYLVGRVNQTKLGVTRPFGFVVLPLVDLIPQYQLTSPTPSEFIVSVRNIGDGSEGAFNHVLYRNHDLHGSNIRSEKISVSLSCLIPDSDFYQSRHGYLKSVTISTPPLGMFIREQKPVTLECSLYMTIEDASFFSVKKPQSKNIRVTAEIHHSSGGIVPNCFIDHCNLPPAHSYSSMVYDDCTHPVWNETVRLDLDPGSLGDMHVVLFYRHVPVSPSPESLNAKPLGFSFLRLTGENSCVIPDGQVLLKMYKFDDSLFQSPSTYLSCPSRVSDNIDKTSIVEETASIVQPLNDTCTISLRWQSSKVSQNISLHNFFNWKRSLQSSSRNLELLLGDTSLVGEEDVAKFAQTILDTILDMYVHLADQHSPFRRSLLLVKNQIFEILVLLLSIVSDPRFVAAKELLEKHIDAMSMPSTIGSFLCTHFCQVIDHADQDEEAKLVRKCLKVGHYIVRLIILSCNKASPERLFARETIKGYFVCFLQMMALETPDHIMGSQSLAYQHLDSILKESLSIFSFSELCSLVLERLLTISTIKSKLHAARLHMMRLISKWNVSTESVIELSLSFLESALLKSTGVAIVSSFVHDSEVKKNALLITRDVLLLISGLQVANNDQSALQHKRLYVVLIALAHHVCENESVRDIQEISSILVSFLSAYDSTALVLLCGNILTDVGFVKGVNLLILTLDVFNIIFHGQYFEKSQLRLHASVYFECFKFLSMLLQVVTIHACTPFSSGQSDMTLMEAPAESDDDLSKEFDAALSQCWDTHFIVSIDILNCPLAKLQNFPSQDVRLLAELGNDFSVQATNLLCQSWTHFYSLSAFKKGHNLPRLATDSLLDLIWHDQDLIACIAADLVFTSITQKIQKQGDFLEWKNIVIDKVYMRLQTSAFDLNDVEKLCQLFENRLKLADDTVSSPLKSFTKLLKKEGKLLCAYHDSNEIEEQCVSLQQLLVFFKQANRPGLFVKYVHELYDLHMSREDFVEAAIALKQHADTLAWSSDVILEPLPEFGFPQWETELDRKKSILLNCIQLLDKGNAWERCVDIAHDIASHLKTKSWDYHGLAETLHVEASFYEKIVKDERIYPSYFHVSYHGLQYPKSIRSKPFVYRGDAFEKISSFAERLQQQYPDAKLVMKGGTLEKSILEGDGKWIQIFTIDPLPDFRRWIPLLENKDTRGLTNLIDWNIISASSQESRGLDAANTSEKDTTAFPLWLAEPDLFAEHDKDGTDIMDNIQSLKPEVKSYFLHNEVSSFCYSRPIRKSTTHLSNSNPAVKELLGLWIEKTILFTKDTFPCLGRRSRVKQTMTFEISPIENAIISIKKKTRQLLDLERKYNPFKGRESNTIIHNEIRLQSRKASFNSNMVAPIDTKRTPRHSIDILASNSSTSSPTALQSPRDSILSSGGNSSFLQKSISNPAVNINPFTMALNGAVDAPVNGGVPLYRLAFFSDACPSTLAPPSLKKALEDAILQQVQAIYQCLMLHELVVPVQIRPLHEELVKLFHKNFASELETLNLTPLQTMTQLDRQTDQEKESDGLFKSRRIPSSLTRNTSSSRRSSFLSKKSSGTGMFGFLSNLNGDGGRPLSVSSRKATPTLQLGAVSPSAEHEEVSSKPPSSTVPSNQSPTRDYSSSLPTFDRVHSSPGLSSSLSIPYQAKYSNEASNRHHKKLNPSY